MLNYQAVIKSDTATSLLNVSIFEYNSLKQSQEQQGDTIESARLENYAKIGKNARSQKNSGNYQDMSEVQAHTAEAAKSHGRKYDPSVPSSIEKVDAYQGNMSAALEHKDEIVNEDIVAD